MRSGRRRTIDAPAVARDVGTLRRLLDDDMTGRTQLPRQDRERVAGAYLALIEVLASRPLDFEALRGSVDRGLSEGPSFGRGSMLD